MIGIIVTCLTITIIKYLTNRDRPDPEKILTRIKQHYISNIKTDQLRKGEGLKSFPSGDSAQAGLLTCFLLHIINTKHSLDQHQKTICSIVCVLLCGNVMLARIYYLCHYVMDTVFGTVIGFGVGMVFTHYYVH